MALRGLEAGATEGGDDGLDHAAGLGLDLGDVIRRDDHPVALHEA